MKNPFKKNSIIDTVVNVGIGGAANVAMDYVFGLIPEQTWLTDTVKSAIKVGVAAVGGSMVGGKAAKYIRPAFDGIGVVGASELINGLVAPASGLPYGMQLGTGKIYVGQKGYKNHGGRGVNGNPDSFMSK